MYTLLQKQSKTSVRFIGEKNTELPEWDRQLLAIAETDPQNNISHIHRVTKNKTPKRSVLYTEYNKINVNLPDAAQIFANDTKLILSEKVFRLQKWKFSLY